VRYGFDFAIAPGDLRLGGGADGIRRGDTEVMIVAYDRNGVALNSFRKKSEMILDPQKYAEVMRVGLQMHREMGVPEGKFFCGLGFMI